MGAPRGAKRELRNVRVRFVSMVGKPANRTPFVAKSGDGPGSGEVVLFKSEGWDVPAEKDAGKGRNMVGKLIDLLAGFVRWRETPPEPVVVTKTEEDGDGVSAALTSLCEDVSADS